MAPVPPGAQRSGNGEAAIGDGPSRLAALRGIRLGDVLWRSRSVRAQLIIILVLIDIVAALATCGVIIAQTRTSVQVEVASSMKLADLLVQETIQMQQDVSVERVLSNLPLQLRFLRHVRISVQDLNGRAVTAHAAGDTMAGTRSEDREAAPAWFAALVASPDERHEFPVDVKGQRIGSVVVTGEPRDEIAEAWEHTTGLATVSLALNLAVIGILYLLFGRVLDPVARLASGLSDLERKNYEIRLPPPNASELATIMRRFNALAEALQTMRAENRQLNRRLITVQDDERRNIALELHDEVGPSLFGLKAMASSIAAAAGELKDAAGHRLDGRVREMLGLIEHMQAVNRSLLNRLRPMALGHVPLESMLSELVRDRGRQHPQLSFSFSGGDLKSSYGDSIDLTIYRCMQESLTNAMKHADARHIEVGIRELSEDDGATAPPRLTLSVRDDGRGIDPAQPPGFGLLGMRERVQALGGHYAVESGSGRGTCVQIVIPIHGGAS